MTNTAILKRPLAAVIVLGTLALGGCSGTNVGSSWQCPLARGGTCDSVAGADPAVPRAASAPDAVPGDGMTIREPLYRVRGGRPEPAAEPCEAGCGFDPFAWLARLFGADREDSASPKPAPERNPLEAALQTMTGPVGESGDQSSDQPVDAASVPAAPDPGAGEPAVAEPVASSSGESLRSEEVVARIWIAPFVDANGVYREASHVRAVLEPAGWRVP